MILDSMPLLDHDLFAAFLLATVALVLMPGPIVTLVVANSLTYGVRTGLATVAGTSSGNALLVAAGALGLTTLLALLAGLFEWIRWLGAVYLVYLGLRQWRAAWRPAMAPETVSVPSARGVFGQGILVAVTNPKTILFYAAFFPQFLDTALPVAPQLAAMSVAFVLIAIAVDTGYALLAGRLRFVLVSARHNRLRHGITGTLLIATGLGLALARRSS